MSSRIRSLLLTLTLAASACGGSAREGAGNVEYSVSAAQNYEQGMKKMTEEEWVDAAKYFAFVKARFPYSKYAVLADLRLADCEFGAESYLEAIDAYKLFIKFHPTHEMVENGYAPFRIGESYVKMLPTDWFLVPPGYEMDQTMTQDAARELATFIKRYPKSTFLDKARKMYRDVAHLLAAHEWYVANFYWKKERPMGTVLRLRTLLKDYPDVGFDEDALMLLGRAYARVGRKDDAKKSFQTLLEKYPKSGKAPEAKQELGKLGG